MTSNKRMPRLIHQSDFISMCCVLCRLNSVRLFTTLWTAAWRAPLSVGFSRQEYWSGLPCPPPGVFPTQELNPGLLDCKPILDHLSHQGSPKLLWIWNKSGHSLYSYFIPRLCALDAHFQLKVVSRFWGFCSWFWAQRRSKRQSGSLREALGGLVSLGPDDPLAELVGSV